MALRGHNPYIMPVLTLAVLSFCAGNMYAQVYENVVTRGVASGSALSHRGAIGTTSRFRRFSTGIPVAPPLRRRPDDPMAYNNRVRGSTLLGSAQPGRSGRASDKKLSTLIQPQKLGQRLSSVMRTPPVSAGASTARNSALFGNRFGRINTPKFGAAGGLRAYGGGTGRAGGFGDSSKSALLAKSSLLSGRSLLGNNQLTPDRSLLNNSKSILNYKTRLSGKTSLLTGR